MLLRTNFLSVVVYICFTVSFSSFHSILLVSFFSSLSLVSLDGTYTTTVKAQHFYFHKCHLMCICVYQLGFYFKRIY